MFSNSVSFSLFQFFRPRTRKQLHLSRLLYNSFEYWRVHNNALPLHHTDYGPAIAVKLISALLLIIYWRIYDNVFLFYFFSQSFHSFLAADDFCSKENVKCSGIWVEHGGSDKITKFRGICVEQRTGGKNRLNYVEFVKTKYHVLFVLKNSFRKRK